MKNNLLFLIIVLGLENSVCAQTNLIPNSDFEVYTTCPDNQGQIERAVPWHAGKMLISSSEYFNRCSSNKFASVPVNVKGYQEPRSGDGYVGIFTYGVSAIDTNKSYREYISVKLDSQLTVGVQYYFEMYVNKSDTYNLATGSFGAVFTTYKMQRPANDYFLIEGVMPLVDNPNNLFVTDETGWTKISGKFIADSAYEHITIGNFRSNAETDTLKVAHQTSSIPLDAAYYYLDDLLLQRVVDSTKDSTIVPGDSSINVGDTLSGNLDMIEFFPNSFSPNMDGYNDYFGVRINHTVTDYRLIIFDRQGAKLFESSNPADSWSGMGWNNKLCEAGNYTYYCSFIFNEEMIQRIGNLTLVY